MVKKRPSELRAAIRKAEAQGKRPRKKPKVLRTGTSLDELVRWAKKLK